MLFDIAIYKSSNIERGGAGFVCGLRDGESVEQLIQNLDGFLVLGLGVGRVRRSRIHNIDGGHYFEE